MISNYADDITETIAEGGYLVDRHGPLLSVWALDDTWQLLATASLDGDQSFAHLEGEAPVDLACRLATIGFEIRVNLNRGKM